MKRLIVAILAGSAVTFGLLFMMQALIASGQSAMTDIKEHPHRRFRQSEARGTAGAEEGETRPSTQP
jgi:hypothetical protein